MDRDYILTMNNVNVTWKITIDSNDDKYLQSAYCMPSMFQNALCELTHHPVRLVMLL